uniref:BRO family protein n=1 Tax=Dechloromonas aromatica (strain RCB) TaxID=159087 RepID=Q47D43_DECAR
MLFGKQVSTVSLLAESGLYKMVLRSRTQQAQKFQDWVTKEVLPSIRKTGSFVTGGKTP